VNLTVRETQKNSLMRLFSVPLCLCVSLAVFAQTPTPQTAEQVFKDVQILKGIPVDEFMDTMGFFSASLSLNCTDCHGAGAAGSWASYADNTPLKQTARRMMRMVADINKEKFAGARAVTCFTCHGGSRTPKVIPSLAIQYGAPVEDPNDVEARDQDAIDPVLDKYIQAVGGAQRAAALTSFAARGTYAGYDTDHQKVPVEIFAKAPDQYTMIVHGVGATNGDSIRVFDGRAGWIASPDKPVPLITLTGGNLTGARIDAILAFPGIRIKEAFSQWRTGSTTIDDRDVVVLQGTNPRQPPLKLYFDTKSGLLVRQVRYSDSPIGMVPTQVEYADYRDVSGVKVPFKWTVTWTDNQTFIELTAVQPNVSIDASRFARPRPAR
jgi:photosynthetic reaction center cytochrome c subunit